MLWAANQVIDAYSGLCALIHGGEVDLTGDHEDFDDSEDRASEPEAANDADADATPTTHAHAGGNGALRPEVIVPTVTCEDAAALSVPAPGTVHLICVDPPYYNNVQYAELSNFFYVWLKRALKDWPGLAHLFTEPLAETNREAVANAARWQREAETERSAWQARVDAAFARLRANGAKVAEAKRRAREEAGPEPASAKDRADLFYENKMAAVFARGRKLLHPAGRMVVMFNHKQTWAWRSLGMALIRAGFEVRSSVPIHTEAESSLNIRGLDAARSTVLLLCLPREEREQAPGNWASVQTRVSRVARAAAERFQGQGLRGRICIWHPWGRPWARWGATGR
jgi:adenine-specific DNA methylase